MSLLERLIEQVADEQRSLWSLLLSAKAIGHQLKSNKLKKWADAELVGYAVDVVVPDYRIVYPRSKGTFRTQQGLVHTMHKPVFIELLPEAGREEAGRHEVRESANKLERSANNHSHNGYTVSWPNHVIEKYPPCTVAKAENCVLIAAHWLITRDSIEDVLHSIRVRLQELLIEIRTKQPESVEGRREITQGAIQEVDTLVTQILYKDCTIIQGDQPVTNKNIHAGRDINVGGSLVVADSIQNSFNQIAGSPAPDPVKASLQQLGEALKAMTKELPEEQAKQIAEDFRLLSEQAANPKPNQRWVTTALEGLKEAATAASSVATIATVAASVPGLLEQVKNAFGF